MKEVSKEYIKEQEPGFIYYLYNPLTNQTKEEILDKNSIVFSKYCYEGLKFYINEE
ncbi:MAG: hypothetical protein VZQ62_00860 [Methanosphaera sp.]|nr:hypothetical protein [Methanosphaera sp.]